VEWLQWRVGKNRNRGYQQLRVWQDAQELYSLIWAAFKNAPYKLKRVVSPQIASVDSVHRKIAEEKRVGDFCLRENESTVSREI